MKQRGKTHRLIIDLFERVRISDCNPRIYEGVLKIDEASAVANIINQTQSENDIGSSIMDCFCSRSLHKRAIAMSASIWIGNLRLALSIKPN